MIKTFKHYLIESKDRFIKKNKNLSKEQQKEIINFFKINRQAEKKIDWQKSHSMSYDDFLEIMMDFKSGRKSSKSKKIRCPNKLRGLTAEEDYIQVKMKTKEYCAFIPFSWETAQHFNRDNIIGTCSGSWCIGSTLDKSEWNNHILNGAEVPIYVVDGINKWVVMIQSGNISFDIWDEDNDSPSSSIPNFNVKKELLSSKQKKLYDEIRDEIYSNDEDVFDMKLVDKDQKALHDDIKENAIGVINNYNTYEEEWLTSINDMIEYYEATEFDLNNIYNEYKSRLLLANDAILKTKHDFDTVKFENQLYTKIEMSIFISKLKAATDLSGNNLQNFRDDFSDAVESLEEVKNDGVPLDEDMDADAMYVIEDYLLADMNHISFPEWEDVYDEYYNGVQIYNAYGLSTRYENYLLYMDNEYHYEVDFAGFQEDINEFIANAFIDTRREYVKRTNRITDEEVWLLFDNRGMTY